MSKKKMKKVIPMWRDEHEEDDTPMVFKLVPKTEKAKRTVFKRGVQAFLVAGGCGWLYFNSSLSELGVVRFDGLSYVSKSDILQLAALSHDEKMVEINTKKIETQLTTHPLIKSAEVKKQALNELAISIEEESVLGCVLLQEGTYLLTTAGVWVDQESVPSQTCQGVLFYDMDYIDKETNIKLLTESLLGLGTEFIALIEGVYYEPHYGDINRFSLELKDGNTIKVNVYSLLDKLKYYPTMVNKVKQTFGEVTGTFHLDVGDRFSVHEQYLDQIEALAEESEDIES